MLLASARSLKEEILARNLTRRVITRTALPREAAVVRSALPAEAPPPPIALGIEGRDGDFRLAVRIQAVTPGLQRNLDRIFQEARGEVSMKIIGRLVKQQASRDRPPLIGSSVGHPNVMAGTIGCFVTSNGSDRLLLSNNHVLADENRASFGDEVLQPGRADGGSSPQDRVAALSSFIALSGSRNRVDAALALMDPGIQVEEEALAGLGVLQGVRADPLEDDETIVHKIGRTTKLTRGRVSAFEVDDVSVDFDLGAIGFDGQIEIEALDGRPFSLGGDSGSLIVDEGLRAVGLLFAGNDVDITYANPIAEVFKALKVRLP